MKILAHLKTIFFKTNTVNILFNNICSSQRYISNRLPPDPRMSDLIQNKSHIVWVDLEMTGLDIDKEQIIEMACLM
jgi:oligoribonuclease (3'-5' exoribonuclease)